MVGNELQRLNERKYDEACDLIKRCFRDDGRKADKHRFISVNPLELMKYHPFFVKLSSRSLRELLKASYFIKLSESQLLYTEAGRTKGGELAEQ